VRHSLILALTLLAFGGCYRTHYVNLQPANVTVSEPATRSNRSGWQHFFLFGWVPSERVYTADTLCGSNAVVTEIRTERTFVQGLVEQLCSYYVNIYSPYNAEVFCASPANPDHVVATPSPLPSVAPPAE